MESCSLKRISEMLQNKSKDDLNSALYAEYVEYGAWLSCRSQFARILLTRSGKNHEAQQGRNAILKTCEHETRLDNLVTFPLQTRKVRQNQSGKQINQQEQQISKKY